jgi:hypothetical protein
MKTVRQQPARKVPLDYGSVAVTDVLPSKQDQRNTWKWRKIDPSLEAPEISRAAFGRWKNRIVESGSLVDVVRDGSCDQTHRVGYALLELESLVRSSVLIAAIPADEQCETQMFGPCQIKETGICARRL